MNNNHPISKVRSAVIGSGLPPFQSRGDSKPTRVNNARDHKRRDCRQRAVSRTSELRWLLWLPVLLLAHLAVHAQICTEISPGEDIQSALNSCGSGSTAVFAAGTYDISSSLTWPCGVSISGPVVPWPGPYEARINWTGSGSAFNYPACSVDNVVFQYMEVAGNPGSNLPGGGAIHLSSAGGTGPAIQNDYLHGVQSDTDASCCSDGEIYVDGTGTAQGYSVWSNLQVLWNIFGAPGDCSALMNTYSYNGNNYDKYGGFCDAVDLHTSTTNLTMDYNRTVYLEEGFKFQEPAPNGGQVGASDPSANQYIQTNTNVMYNDFGGIHRIAIEAQDTPNSTENFNYNDWHDPVYPGYGSFTFSLPQYENGAGYSNMNSNISYNVFASNVAVGSGGGYIPGVEFWGTGQANYNLYQGNLACGAQFGFGNTPWELNYNTYQGNGSNVCNEENQSTNPDPTQTGNTSATNVSALTSVAPEINPSSGTVGSSQTVTFTNPGTNRDANTGIWVTTDGSIPVPGSGSAKYYSSGQTLVVTEATTVKAVGMWGAANQPYSYPAGFGYVPSNVVTEGIPGPPTKRLVSAFLVSKGNVASIPVGRTLQFIANGVYSDGTVAPLPDSEGDVVTAWNTSNHAVAKISSLGHVTAMGVGTVTIEGMIGDIRASTSQLSVTVPTATGVAGSPRLVSAFLVSKGNVASIPVGRTLQFIANGVYSDGTVAPLPDSEGNVVTAWNTSNHAVAKISSLGHVTAMGVGTVTIEGMIGDIKASTSQLSVTVPTATGVAASVNSSLPEAMPEAALPVVGGQYLGSLWQLVNPAGGSATIADGHLSLFIPGGSNHDLLPSNHSVRAMQDISDETFDVSMKISSPISPTNNGTSEGLMVLSENGNFITFALRADGSNIALTAQRVAAGVATTFLDLSDFSQYQNPIYLRIVRTGSAYMAFYSTDGQNWTQGTGFTDEDPPAQIGPFASNYNSNPADALPVVMSVAAFDIQR
jgi:hypothetical protein